MPGWCRLSLALALCSRALLPAQSVDSADAAPSIERLAAAASESFPAGFEQAALARAARDHLPEPYARIAVRRDLARHFEAQESWLSAIAHLQEALEIASVLDDAATLATLHLELAENQPRVNQRHLAHQHLDELEALLPSLDRPDLTLRSAFLRIELLRSSGPDSAVVAATYQRLLRDDRFDPFIIQLHRARFTPLDESAEARTAWIAIRRLAQDRKEPAIEAEALDQLGELDYIAQDFPQAARHFRAAETLVPHPSRSGGQWRDVIATYLAVGNSAHAAAAVARALDQTDENADPALAAILYQHRAVLHEKAGDLVAAYQDSKHALALRDRRDATRQFAPLTRMIAATSDREKSDAATLAATRAALRESELNRSRLERRQAYGIGFTALLAAVALGIAYAYKRRSAAALAIARDNAELRAERTHWQMLRYQLNPHFLFNALSSLGGLVGTAPAKAAHCVDRLSEFCHLALEGAHDDLRTLSQEIELLRAYLDVEQTGSEDLLITIDADPDVMEFRIPPLLLQPLVENALKYGAQTSEEMLELRLHARRGADGALLIDIANTGHWVEPDARPRRRVTIGLANVRERLARLNPPGSLDFRHQPGWVIARLTLPPA